MLWFHCGRCGSLFQSAPGEVSERLCTHCGAKPSLGIESPRMALPTPVHETTSEAAPSHQVRSSKRSKPANSLKSLTLKISLGWIGLLAIIILIARWQWQDDSETTQQAAQDPSSNSEQVDQETQKQLEKSLPLCTKVFSAFLAATTQEEQSQFVLSGPLTARKMARFYSANPVIRLNAADLSPVSQTLLKLADGPAIETLWNSKDGKKIEAVFRQQDGEWKLDWDHYARFSDHPWALFLAGSGNPEGEFRLLARERLAEERKNAEDISMILYGPRFGNPEEAGFQSPEFLVKRNSLDGRLLESAFKLAKAHKQAYNSSAPYLNPDGMIRIRVKVKRVNVDDLRKFEITNVIACHWYGIDDPGVTPLAESSNETKKLDNDQKQAPTAPPLTMPKK